MKLFNDKQILTTFNNNNLESINNVINNSMLADGNVLLKQVL